MIADGDVFVVGQERIVGTEELADARGVMDGGVEVGVVADLGGKLHLHIAHGNEHRLQARFCGGIPSARGEQRRDSAAERRPGCGAERHQIGFRGFAACRRRRRRKKFAEKALAGAGAQIEDLVADGDADARGMRRCG